MNALLSALLLASYAIYKSTADTNDSGPSDDTLTSDCKFDSFLQELLDAHNKYRALHGVKNLTLDCSISDYAHEWAENLAKINQLTIRPDNVYGENLFSSSSRPTAQTVADTWYSQVKNYTNYNVEPDMSNFRSGLFTQMVWKSSELLGCGRANSSRGGYYLFCDYDPAGNVKGQFVANVLKPTSS